MRKQDSQRARFNAIAERREREARKAAKRAAKAQAKAAAESIGRQLNPPGGTQ